MAEKKVLVYQLWPIAWGSIRLMTAFLPRIKALGVDYVWLSPIYASPWHNHGYDVADYYSIEPRLGTLKDFKEFVRAAHALHLKVIMDLVIDSTSVEHLWFRTNHNKSMYIWERRSRPSWQNLLDYSSAWQLDNDSMEYYLHMSHPSQADLNWFLDGVLNRSLVENFKNIMYFWLFEHDVDGFRVGSIQSLNKDLSKEEMKFDKLLINSRAIMVIRELSNLYSSKTPFLMIDCLDPSYGDVLDYYATETDVEFVTNGFLKETITPGPSGKAGFKARLDRQCEDPKFMLDLESHDSCRFTSRSGMDGKEVIDLMFGSKAQAICIYQGQELGLKNPSEKDLPMVDMMNLDARAALYFKNHHITAESLRQNSRANNRLPIPLDEYTRQEEDENSVLNYAKTAIHNWRHQ